VAEHVKIGSVDELRAKGWLTGKAGSQPVCVFESEGELFALDDRCPHMGFPLHRGTVESGLLTCHWHNARFDLSSGGTLDPWADDVRAYPVAVDDGTITVVVEADQTGRVEHLRRRLEEGLEQGISLVIAKAVLGLLDAGVAVGDIVRVGTAFGTRYREAGWGAGLTVLTAMANVVPHLDPEDRGLALVHGLAFVSRDTRGRAPRFPLLPLGGALPAERLTTWYRRFIETRSADAAERTLATAIADAGASVAGAMFGAATDHVLLDGGHTVDFTNKAFEALDHLGPAAAAEVLPTLVAQTASASRSEEQGSWRYPHDLTALIRAASSDLPDRIARSPGARDFAGVAALAWAILSEDPKEVVTSVDEAVDAGATLEELGRAVAYAAALRMARFHTQNDHADWDEVHHAFTYANALHQAIVRTGSPELARGVYHGALRVYLDRFLNIPAARLPSGPVDGPGDLAELDACWDQEGRVDDAGAIVYRYLAGGGDPARAVAALGHALLTEDAEFHWFQTYEAAVRQFHAWPPGSEEGALILVGAARFLAAHTPTRRELSQVVRIATRLRRGEALFEDA
jgi:nitrite reductase/ring-hydroxylating ferredoxin subunit